MAVELSIIIPSFNDREPLIHLLNRWVEALAKEGINYQIYLYNDGSKKAESLEIYKKIEAEFSQVKITHKENEGHGPTILRGYEEHQNSPWILQIDSDDEIGPENFIKLWHRRGDFQFLFVERVYTKRPLVRKITSLISRYLVRTLYGGNVNDTNSPFRLMSSDFLKVALPAIPHETFAPNVLLMAQVIHYDIPHYSFPIELIDVGTPTTLGIKRLLKGAIQTFLEILWHRLEIYLT